MRPIRYLIIFVALAGLLGIAPVPVVSAQQADLSWASADQQKDFWQGRFRELRQRAALLRRDAAIEWELYADANRRNYRRGKVRHIHRDKAIELEVELAEVETELRALPEAARRAGALPGWLREVEFEKIELPEPGSTEEEDVEGVPTAPGDLDAIDRREGRNPIYFEDENEEDGSADSDS